MELTIDQALQQGIVAHKEGKLQDAERLYRAILQSQPSHPDANHNLGVLAVSMNKVEAALPLFKTALAANPKVEQFWLSYIDASIKEKQFDNARDIIEQAKKQGVGGEQFHALEKQLDSINQQENISHRSPSQHQLNNLLGYYQKGKLGEAEKLAMSLTKEFPSDNFSWKILGAIFKITGRDSEAINANQTAVTLSPKDAEAHNNLGNALQAQGKLDDAINSYRQAITLKPNHVDAYYNMGNALQTQGKLNQAISSYLQA